MTSTPKNKQPSHYAYQVHEGANRKSYWSRIGAAWEIKGGFSIQIDSVPLDGKIVLQLPKAEHEVENGSSTATA